MKVNYLNLSHPNSMYRKGHYENEQSKFKCENTRENYNYSGPAQAISFSGSVVSMLQKGVNKASNKIVETRWLNKLVYAVNDNEAAFNAVYALLIAGILKPTLILAQAGFDDKDMQLVATKNFLQAFVGSFLGYTVGGKFIKKIYDNMDNNLNLLVKNGDSIGHVEADSEAARSIAKKIIQKEKTTPSFKWNNAIEGAKKAQGFEKIKEFYRGTKIKYEPLDGEIKTKAAELIENLKPHMPIFEKNKDFTSKLIDNIQQLKINPSSLRRAKDGPRSQLYDSFASIFKNSTGSVTTIAKAVIASTLLTPVVAMLFTPERMAKAREKKRIQNASTLLNTNSFQNQKAQYGAFAKKDNSEISFKGSLDKAINTCTRGIENIAMTKAAQNFTEGMSNLAKKPSARMADIESIMLTLYWVLKTGFSKNIDPDQKLGFNAHTVLVTIISSLAALGIDWATDGFINKLDGTYQDRLKETAKTVKDNLKDTTTSKDIENIFMQQCSKLYDIENVAKTLSNKDLFSSVNEKELMSKIDGLSYGYSKQLSKFKSLVIFTFVVRFLVPVCTVRLSKAVKKFLIKKSEELAQKKNHNLEKTA